MKEFCKKNEVARSSELNPTYKVRWFPSDECHFLYNIFTVLPLRQEYAFVIADNVELHGCQYDTHNDTHED